MCEFVQMVAKSGEKFMNRRCFFVKIVKIFIYKYLLRRFPTDTQK